MTLPVASFERAGPFGRSWTLVRRQKAAVLARVGPLVAGFVAAGALLAVAERSVAGPAGVLAVAVTALLTAPLQAVRSPGPVTYAPAGRELPVRAYTGGRTGIAGSDHRLASPELRRVPAGSRVP